MHFPILKSNRVALWVASSISTTASVFSRRNRQRRSELSRGNCVTGPTLIVKQWQQTTLGVVGRRDVSQFGQLQLVPRLTAKTIATGTETWGIAGKTRGICSTNTKTVFGGSAYTTLQYRSTIPKLVPCI